MSGQKKKNSSRSSSAKTTTKKTGSKAVVAEKNNIYQEVILWVMLAVSVVLFVSNFGIGGKVGDLLSSFFFGVFGLLAYIFPILLFIGTVFIMSNGKNKIAVIKVIAAILFVCFLCFFLELLSGVKRDYSPVASYLHGMSERNGGGFIGGVFSWLICPNFGRVSAFVIDFIVLIITMVVVTERSAWKHVQKGGKRVYESAKEGNERLREIQEQRREEREIRRMERKISGVSADTKLVDEKNVYIPSDALTEITFDSYQKLPEQIPVTGHVNAEPVLQETVLEHVTPDFGQMHGIEPEVIQKHQVSLKPLEEPVAEVSEDAALETEMPIFSPELQSLFAQAEEAEADAEGIEEETVVQEPDLPKDLEQLIVAQTMQEVEAPVEEMAEEPLYEANEVQDVAMEPMISEAESFAPQEHVAHVTSAPTNTETKKMTSFEPKTEQKVSVAESETETDIQAEIAAEAARQEVKRTYVFPPIDLLKKGDSRRQGDSKQHLQQTALKLQQTLKNFGVNVTILNVSCGPTVTRYEIQPEMGVKVSKIVNLTDDIKLNLAAADIRMEAPIPGKAAIGIEVPNKETTPVMFRDLIESDEFSQHTSSIAFAAGRDIGGEVIMADIAKMPHLLIAGATGSGKSVCINTIIMSLLYRADPEDVKLILIDPKVVELSVYNGIPHLFIPVVTDPKKAAGALNWAVAEMTERYQKFATYGVRDLKGYNAKVEQISDINDPDKPKKLPQIVIIVDELADLMMVAPGDVEDAICRLAQLARACGIHLIIATQRPSVNVITGLIKANMPSRIAFSVTSGVDSRTILDMVGAEKLLGKGDCLYYPQGLNKPLRVQGAFVSDQEVSDVVAFIKDSYGQASYDNSIEEKMSRISEASGSTASASAGGNAYASGGRDAYFVDAAKLLMDKDKASIGMLQRYFKIGFNRAARIMDQLEEAGVVGPEEGTKPRQIMMNPETFEALLEDGSF